MNENEQKNSSNKDFIEEKIKEKPINKKRFVIRLLLTLVIAAAAACVAAIVFVNMIPVAEKISGRESVKEKISIMSEEASESSPKPSGEPTEEPGTTASSTATPTPEPSEEAGDKKTEDKQTEESKGEGKQAEDSKDKDQKSEGSEETSGKEGSDEPTEIVKEEVIYKEITLDDYIRLHEQMTENAEKVQRAIVSVTGITSMLDYFDNTYENSQQMTGVIVADTGEELYILTGYSVLENVERIQVTFADGYVADAFFQRNDPDTGLAVVRVSEDNIPEETMEAINTARFTSRSSLKPGDRIMAAGTILGYNHSLTYGTVISTAGTFSASDCEYSVISTDLGTGKGSSGVIMNLRGSVTGIIIPPDKSSSDSSLSAFAIEDIKGLIEALSNNEARPYLGIHGMDVTDRIAERSGIAKGILITSIEDESPAMLAGIMDHDILIKVGDENVMTMEEYEKALAKYEPGTEIHVVTMRIGNEGYVEVDFDVEVGEI